MKTSKLAMGAVFGAAVGIVAGIMTAPKSGKETRDDLKRKALEVKDQTTAQKDELLFKAEELTDDVRQKANDLIESVKSAVNKK